MDLLRESGLRRELIAVTIAGGTWRVPKRDLVVGLQIAAGMREGETVKVSTARHEGYAAWRDGAHDDLMLAAALACWRAQWREAGHVGRSLGVE